MTKITPEEALAGLDALGKAIPPRQQVAFVQGEKIHVSERGGRGNSFQVAACAFAQDVPSETLAGIRPLVTASPLGFPRIADTNIGFNGAFDF
ncbi:hypothetical protein EN932_37230 [Mesorhizobium sp. M7A.F.Ca.US.002.01.1.1]|nr:hypothetical protein EN932_37230 [Mesorhizobium sp. M7A.F.Ca.US.002.01.1.1]